MKVHILDDWFDTLRGLPCFAKLKDHDVTVWTDHEPDPEKLAARVADAEALVLFRERTKIGEPLLSRTPKLELISHAAHLAFPIRDGIPVMLIDEARDID